MNTAVTALQNSGEVLTLRLATARNRSTPRMRQGMWPIGNKNPAWPRPDALSPARTGELATANFREFLFHALG
jgi:hypothetical protein